ncbi:MAG: SH3 domain-containing protein [Rickettsiales endosymbiont of Dermacentor nuttalli]
MKTKRIVHVFLVIAFIWVGNVYAEKLPIPRFVSVKSNEVNMRAGPSVRYPILWTIVKKGEPVEVLAEFEHWRKVRDKQGDEAWVHESMLTGKRVGVVIGNQLQVIYNKPNNVSKKICILEPELRVNIVTCKQEWCLIQVEKCKGWLLRSSLWGIYSNEEIH